MTLEWGVLGTGNIAHSFAGHLNRSQTGRLVAVGSRSRDVTSAIGRGR
jgi:predicted dehydrogenase